MLFLSFVFLTRKLHTWIFVFQTSNMSPPPRCLPGWGWGVDHDTSVPLSTRHLFHWRRPLLGGIRRLAMTLTQPSLPPYPHPHRHTPPRTYARIRTPTHNPSVANHFPFSWATQTKQQMTCVVCVWLMSGSIVFGFHTFHSPARSREEANVSIMKQAANVPDYMCMYVAMRGRGMGYRLHHVSCVSW